MRRVDRFYFARASTPRMQGMHEKKKQSSLSAREQERRAQQRAQSLAAVEQLLYTRRQTGRALGGISVATVIRLENKGLLDKVRLAGGSGEVFHRASQVHALAEGDHA
jgi:two-component sensor histidine kinase